MRTKNVITLSRMWRLMRCADRYSALRLKCTVTFVELKAIEQLAAVHKAQVNSYLKITLLKVGLLFNFNTVVLKDGIKRIIRA